MQLDLLISRLIICTQSSTKWRAAFKFLINGCLVISLTQQLTEDIVFAKTSSSLTMINTALITSIKLSLAQLSPQLGRSKRNVWFCSYLFAELLLCSIYFGI